MATDKKNVLLVGSGAIGTLAAFSLTAGGRADVTAVLRSNYAVVEESGFVVDSFDYGLHEGWKPSKVLNKVPDVTADGLPPYDYIVVATKNYPDIPPTVSEIIAPAVTPGHTAIVLIQNGLNIEKPLVAAFPTNAIVSGVSLTGSAERSPGHIVSDEHDVLIVGPFVNPGVGAEASLAAARTFVEIYGASGKVTCELNEDVGFVRWRKLVYNACYNPLATILRMDTSQLRLAETPIADLVRPAMWEVWRAAKAAGHDVPKEHIENTINADPIDVWCKPSMLQDAEKGNYIEYINLIEEPVKEAEKLGVPTPILKVILDMCRALQWKAKVAKGLVTLPAGAPPS
ncbi:hypothetical protein SCUCBS95973_004465 [Sporothrix curviconia]|uniref:2-dehydropantoate 2-reductase n=1 Tax=Sporothrix curviconia TaxID=1260050 RepID=A0ABP0BPA6_9PEZI